MKSDITEYCGRIEPPFAEERATWFFKVTIITGLSPCLFVFCNRKRDKLKILQWEHNGFWLHYRRLERGTFHWPSDKDAEDDVALEYYRNEKTFEGSILLNETGGEYLTHCQHGSVAGGEEEKERLSSIIDRMDDRFGTEFNEIDKLSRDQIVEDMKANEDLAQKAKSNTKDNFKFSFNRTFMDFVVNSMQNN